MPSRVTASAPAPTSGSPSAPAPAAPADPSSAPVSASPSASAPATSSVPPAPSPTRTSASPTATREPTSAPPSPTRTAPGAREDTAGTLRRGDRGPAVTDLQRRLKQLNLYTGEPNGTYNSPTEWAVRTYQISRGIPTRERGAYDALTRTVLEAETWG
nr:peptidoglycan-binding domain-containing protein [Streptomyces sp. SID5785]